MTQHALSKIGYGTLKEVKEMDTPEFLDAVEYESIVQDIELYHIQQRERS